MQSHAAVKDHKKRTGEHFTPIPLAGFLAERLASYVKQRKWKNLTVCDPASGEGSLLTAIADELNGDIGHIIGVESHGPSLKKTEAILRSRFPKSGFSAICADYLELVIESQNENLFTDESAKIPPLDLIIANPPYVRTQILGAHKAGSIGKSFGLTGRVDLYHAFLAAMIQSLRDGGIAGIILSNRFLYTQGGQSLRDIIKTQTNILELYDFGDTQFFDAAVLPAVVILEKSKNPVKKSFPHVTIYESDNSASHKTLSSRYDLLRIAQNNRSGFFSVGQKTFHLQRQKSLLPKQSSGPWSLAGLSLKKSSETGLIPLGDLFKVRVGVKTTADRVFIRKDWSAIIDSKSREYQFIRDLISARKCEKWKAQPPSEPEKRILYPYYDREPREPVQLSDLPAIKQYLESHRDTLEGRTYVTKSGRQWFEIWVPHSPVLWALPKLVFPDIADKPRACIDYSGSIVDGNCYWIPAHNEEELIRLKMIMAVINSSYFLYMYDYRCGNRLYSKKRRFLTQYMKLIPVPEMHSKAKAELVAIADKPAKDPAQCDMEICQILEDVYSGKLPKEYRLSAV